MKSVLNGWGAAGEEVVPLVERYGVQKPVKPCEKCSISMSLNKSVVDGWGAAGEEIVPPVVASFPCSERREKRVGWLGGCRRGGWLVVGVLCG
mmetsp:Transcript_9787/g.18345  ORF Transcript_9787/g.18345 Transcript_9787/m.18345 type:complete len:93 (+) Transcript_9787:292-570(+)